MRHHISRPVLLGAASLALVAAAGNASRAAILNSGFEGLTGSDPTHFSVGLLIDGHSSASSNPLGNPSVYVTPDPAPSWDVSTFAGGTMNPTAAFMPPGALSGQNVGYSSGAVLSQDVVSDIQPSTEYIVSVGVGHPAGGAINYHVWLTSGGFPLPGADDSNSVDIPSSTWGTSAVVWSSPGDVPPGSTLTLSLASNGGVVLFDNVQIIAQTLAPEPAVGVTLIVPALVALRRGRRW